VTATDPEYAFLSYVRQDAPDVDRIQRILEAAGVRVWRDTANLWPGEDWGLKIRQAISADSLVFVACFSDNVRGRTTSYQNEELLLAIDQFRRRQPDQPWLIPVRLSDCPLPHYDLGAGRTWDSLQRVDLFGDRWDEGVARLVAAVVRATAAAASRRADEDRRPLTHVRVRRGTPDGRFLAGEPGVDREAALQEVSESVVAICATHGARDRILGTGFIVDVFGHVLTATQVVERAPKRSGVEPLNLRITLSGGASGTTPVLWDSGREIGAAVLRSGIVGPPLSISPYSPILVGDPVTLFGVNAQSGDLDAVVAEVEAVAQDGSMTLSPIAMRGGYEGGPVVDRSGAVVGMLWQSRDDTSHELRALVVPTTKLVYALEEARHPRGAGGI
jgi:hypothetical protein